MAIARASGDGFFAKKHLGPLAVGVLDLPGYLIYASARLIAGGHDFSEKNTPRCGNTSSEHPPPST
jgi:hypothetical protein